MRMRLLRCAVIILGFLILTSGMASAAAFETLLIHLKTSLKHDDAQICVAYNAIWAALEEGLEVNVLVDADAVHTYKIGLFGKDGVEGYKLPENMRVTLARQFEIDLENIPKKYGQYLAMLRERGAEFFINEEMLITAGIAKEPGDMERLSAKFFKPITLPEMIRLRVDADAYLVY
jgi:hypothetical protein